MRNIYRQLLGTFLLAMLIGLLPIGGRAQSAVHIANFNSEITINPDSSLSVQETIAFSPTGAQPMSGIYRELPTEYPLEFGLRRIIHYKNFSATRDGQPMPNQVNYNAHTLHWEIGDPVGAMPTGNYTVILNYQADAELDFYPDHVELLLPVTGSGWDVPIDSTTATVSAPPGVNGAQQITGNGKLYLAGSESGSVIVTDNGNGSLTFTAGHPLAANEGMNIAMRLPPGLVTAPTADSEQTAVFTDNFSVFFGAIALIIVLLCYLIIWSFFCKHPQPGAALPQLAPPDGMSPALARYIRLMRYDPQTLATALLGLAAKGFLTIEELEDRYILHSIPLEQGRTRKDQVMAASKNPDTRLTTEEEALFYALFPLSPTFSFSYDNADGIQRAIDQLQQSLNLRAEHTFFISSIPYLKFGIVGSSLLLLIIAHYDLSYGTDGAYLLLSLGVLLLSYGTPWLVWKGYQLWHDLFSHFVGRIGNTGLMFKYAFYALAFFVVGILFMHKASGALWLLLLLMTALHLLFAGLLRTPTERGQKVRDALEGFRKYLCNIDPYIISQLSPPEKTPQLFERYLPYALALDAEVEWAQQFNAVFHTAGMAAGAPPALVWYHGPAWQGFHPQQLAVSLREEMAPSMTPLTVPVDESPDQFGVQPGQAGIG